MTLTDEDLLATYLAPPLEQYFFNKLPGLSHREVRARTAECLKALNLAHFSSGDILFSDDIDEIWHLWILQTREYEALCRKLPAREILHHSSVDYPPTQEACSNQDIRRAANRCVTFFALYVRNFGSLSAERLRYWPALDSIMQDRGWDLDRTPFFATDRMNLTPLLSNWEFQLKN
jgi:hypothetical protein